MNGPEHYKAAEQMVANAARHNTEHPGDMRIAEVSAAIAQVHATLALAAAQALPAVTRFMGDSDLVTEWGTAIGWVVPAEIVEDDEDLIAVPVRIADVPEAACGAVREETGIRCGKPKGHTDHHKGTGTDEHGEPMFSRWSNTQETNHG